ncbi:hypothetical protein BD779DRAFT_574487 [Infundibulicybe gibba]|nr:hypothetical protein BD779DRAFT_574487 [Infundibulicybe gibba]
MGLARLFSLLGGSGVDILICFHMLVSSAEVQSGLKSTRRLVNRIMLRVVQTGVITSVAAVGVFILYLTSNSCQFLNVVTRDP